MNAIAEGPLFRRDAKSPNETFDAARRRQQHAEISSKLGHALDRALTWASDQFVAVAADEPLPDPLLPSKEDCLA